MNQPKPQPKPQPKRLQTIIINPPSGDGRMEDVCKYIEHTAFALCNAIRFPRRSVERENIALFWSDAYGKRIQVTVAITVLDDPMTEVPA